MNKCELVEKLINKINIIDKENYGYDEKNDLAILQKFIIITNM